MLCRRLLTIWHTQIVPYTNRFVHRFVCNSWWYTCINAANVLHGIFPSHALVFGRKYRNSRSIDRPYLKRGTQKTPGSPDQTEKGNNVHRNFVACHIVCFSNKCQLLRTSGRPLIATIPNRRSNEKIEKYIP